MNYKKGYFTWKMCIPGYFHLKNMTLVWKLPLMNRSLMSTLLKLTSPATILIVCFTNANHFPDNRTPISLMNPCRIHKPRSICKKCFKRQETLSAKLKEKFIILLHSHEKEQKQKSYAMCFPDHSICKALMLLGNLFDQLLFYMKNRAYLTRLRFQDLSFIFQYKWHIKKNKKNPKYFLSVICNSHIFFPWFGGCGGKERK